MEVLQLGADTLRNGLARLDDGNLDGIGIGKHIRTAVTFYDDSSQPQQAGAVVEARESVPERISSRLQTFHENRQAS